MDKYDEEEFKLKTKKRLKLALIILICIAIMLVGFVGIYTKQLNKYANKLPSFSMAPDLKGETILELEVDDSKETKYYDKNGKEVDSSEVTDENKKNYTSKEEAVNSKDSLTEENYEKCVKIFEDRLKFLQADEYHIDLDSKTGQVVVTVSDDYIEDIENILPMVGKLELVDSKTKDVILDYTNVKKVEATYATDEDGAYMVYLNLKLTDEGVNKVNQLDSYKTTTDDNGEVTTNDFTIQFDKETVGTVSYDDTVLTGKNYRVTMGKKITSSSTMNSTMNMATVVSRLTNIGKTPVVYSVSAEEYINESSLMNTFMILFAIAAAIAVLIALYFIIKYKMNGLLATVGMVTNIAILMAAIRLTHVTISYNSFAAILGFLIMNTYWTSTLLHGIKNNPDKTVWDSVKQAYLKTIDVAVVALIVFVVFAFGGMSSVSTMGLLFFWGWTIVLLGNLLFTSMLLAIRNGK